MDLVIRIVFSILYSDKVIFFLLNEHLNSMSFIINFKRYYENHSNSHYVLTLFPPYYFVKACFILAITNVKHYLFEVFKVLFLQFKVSVHHDILPHSHSFERAQVK